jgi:hypothetical protein
MWPPLCLPTLRKINWGMSSLIVIINPIDQKPPADEGKHVTSSTIIRLSFSFVCTFVAVCSSFVRHSFVQPSPAMADCYVPPHPRFCSLFVLVRSSFVHRLFIILSSFVRRLFVVGSFVVRSFVVRSSLVRRLFVIRSLFVRPNHPPWLIVMYHLIRDRTFDHITRHG